MSQTDDAIAVVRKAYACFEQHDLSGLLQLVGEECDWKAPGPAPESFIGQGQRVMVTGRERDRVKSTGKEYQVEWAHCFKVQNGQIIRFQDDQDTAAIQAAFH
ncbi:MAG: hypothetical protein H7Z12_01280 [Rhodospirillaceae bacterium]|nr:hypothetical protein [Rhodospirillales bacterium]